MNPLTNLSSIAQSEIISLINKEQKIAAIKLYRQETGVGLKEAKDAVDSITAQKKNSSYDSFTVKAAQTNNGCAGVVAAFVAGMLSMLVVFLLMPTSYLLNLKQTQVDVVDDKPKPQKIQKSVVVNKAKTNFKRYKQPSPPVVAAKIFPPVVIPDDLESDLTVLYQQKLASDDYVNWKNQAGLPKGYQSFPQEQYIKYRRAQIAKNIRLPLYTEVINIPHRPHDRVNVDGKIQFEEWTNAYRISLEPLESETSLYLQADDEWLYIAANVPADTTAKGFDQLRFYFHVDLDPAIRNERIHVGRSKRRKLGGIRQTNVRWQGDPPENNDQRWKKYPISDWRIYQLAEGASTMLEHRQFEAKINLKESGLFVGIPFSIFVKVETDPIYENGKFKKRRYLGSWGSQKKPVWVQIK